MTTKILTQNPPQTADTATIPLAPAPVKLAVGTAPASNDNVPPSPSLPATGDAPTGATEIETLLSGYPEGLTADALALLLDRPVTKTKAAVSLLQAQRRLHPVCEGGKANGAKLWRRGPAPAVVPMGEPGAKPEPDQFPPRSAHDVPVLTKDDLIRHARDLHLASGGAAVAKVFGNPTAEVVEQNILAAAIRQTIIRTPAGEMFVALPDRPSDQRSRQYIQIDKKQLETAVAHDLKLPRDLWSPVNVDEEGVETQKKTLQILGEISTLARGGWCFDSGTQASHLNREGELRFRCWERLPIEPKYDAEFDGYLRTLGDEQYGVLSDWFVHAVRTDHPSVALGLAGVNSAGKNVIALAASGLYTTAGTFGEGSLATNSFNDSIVRSPFAVNSEGLPVDHRGELLSSAKLKDAISRNFQVINAKHQRAVTLHGHLRWIVLINAATGDVFPTREVLCETDIDALVRRFVVLEMPQASADYLSKLGGMNYTAPRWITGERRAVKHVAWIVANHKIPPERADDRFGLKSRAEGLRRRLLLNSPTVGTIVSGVVGFISRDPARRDLGPAILVGDGRVAVNVGKIAKLWNRLGSGIAALKQAPQERVIASEIQRIAIRDADAVADGGLAFVPLKLDLILGHAKDMGLAVEEIQKRIEAPRQ